MVFADPLRDVMLQTLRNPDHLFHFAMRNSSADVVAAHVSLFTECVEGTNELGVLSHGGLQRLNDPVVVAVTAGAVPFFPLGGFAIRSGFERQIASNGGDVFQ